MLQVLQKSADAMKQLKSSHVDLQSTTNVKADTGTPTSSTQTPTSVNLQVTGNGDQQLPDQEQMNLTLNNTTKVSEILQGDKVYIKNSKGQWYVLDKNTLKNMAGNPFSGFTIDQNALLGLLQHIKLNDHGTEALKGTNLRHITATLDKNALQQLLASNPQLKSTFGQQNIDTVINDAKSFNSTADVWIDETNFYVHRSELKINLDANTSAIGNGAPAAVNTAQDTIVDLSKFNDAITITPPTNAIPTNDPTTVLGLTSMQ